MASSITNDKEGGSSVRARTCVSSAANVADGNQPHDIRLRLDKFNWNHSVSVHFVPLERTPGASPLEALRQAHACKALQNIATVAGVGTWYCH